jgi:hypothetical protein
MQSDKNITGLRILHHSLIQLTAGDFNMAEHLEILILRHCDIETIDHNIFSHTANLREIDFSFNKIVTLPNELFYGLSSLSKLDLSHNRLETFDIKTLKDSPQILSINLNGNDFTSIINLNEIKKIPQLQNFTFSDNLMSCKLQRMFEIGVNINPKNYCDPNLDQLISIINLWKDLAAEYKAKKGSLQLTDDEYHEEIGKFKTLIDSLKDYSQHSLREFRESNKPAEKEYFKVNIDHVAVFITLVVVLLFFIIVGFMLCIEC